MKKRLIILTCLVLLFSTLIYAYTSGTGVIICGIKYPCGAGDNVCPQDYVEDTSTSSVTFTQVICGGLGPNGEMIL